MEDGAMRTFSISSIARALALGLLALAPASLARAECAEGCDAAEAGTAIGQAGAPPQALAPQRSPRAVAQGQRGAVQTRQAARGDFDNRGQIGKMSPRMNGNAGPATNRVNGNAEANLSGARPEQPPVV